MDEITVDAITENVSAVTAFVNERLALHDFSEKLIFKIDVAIDELFSNIAKYSYAESGGKVTIGFNYDEKEKIASITFIDEGIEYNPLEQPEPDLSLMEDDETVGGLGIFITKNIMDDVQYRYSDGKNILIIYKRN